MDAITAWTRPVTAPAAWTFLCFGAFAIDTGAGPAVPALSRKGRGLLAWLALHQAPVARDRLIGLLWSRRGEDQARQSLRQALSEIRRHAETAGLPAPIATDRDHVAIAHVTTDLALLRTAAATGDLATIGALLGDFPGHLLDDLDGIDPAFDDWLVLERRRQHEARLDSCLIGVHRAQAAARHAEAATLLRCLRGLDPCHEGVAHAAMENAFALGDRDGLRHVMTLHEAALRRELDCRPAPETQALFNRLMAAEWRPAVPQPRAAPIWTA